MIRLIIPACIAMLGGCTAVHPSPPSTQPVITDHANNEGYSLLYNLMDDESNVSKILIIKRVDDSVAGPVKEIANACATATKQLDEYRKQDSSLNYSVTHLPAVESRSRDLQSAAERNRLLGSGGKEFELRLIFTQAEAMNYADTLCRALTEKEHNPARKEFLEHLATQCRGFHERLMKLLSVKS